MGDSKLLRLNVKIHNTFLLAHYAGDGSEETLLYLHSLCVFSIELQIICITVKRLVNLSTMMRRAHPRNSDQTISLKLHVYIIIIISGAGETKAFFLFCRSRELKNNNNDIQHTYRYCIYNRVRPKYILTYYNI